MQKLTHVPLAIAILLVLNFEYSSRDSSSHVTLDLCNKFAVFSEILVMKRFSVTMSLRVYALALTQYTTDHI